MEADRRPTDADGPRPRKKAKTAQHRDLASPLLYVHRDTLARARSAAVPCLYKVWPGGARLPAAERAPRALPARARRGGRAPRRRARRGRPVPARRARADRRRRRLHVQPRALALSRARARTAADAADAGAERAPARAPMVFTSHESRESVLRTYPNAPAGAARARRARGGGRRARGARRRRDRARRGRARRRRALRRRVLELPVRLAPGGPRRAGDRLAVNRALLRDFFASVARGGARGGGGGATRAAAQVHVTHKTIEPFSWWDVPALAARRASRSRGASCSTRACVRGLPEPQGARPEGLRVQRRRDARLRAARRADARDARRRRRRRRRRAPPSATAPRCSCPSPARAARPSSSRRCSRPSRSPTRGATTARSGVISRY